MEIIMYEKYLEQLEEAGKIRNLKEHSIVGRQIDGNANSELFFRHLSY